MKTAIAVSIALFLLAIEAFSFVGTTAHAGYRHHGFWRIAPNLCFLPPDVIVAVNALGPYCSSPRGYYTHRWRY
jgi:hypothetical protein